MTAAETRELPVAAHGSLDANPVASTSKTTPSAESGGNALAAAHLDASLPSELVYSLVLNWRGSKQQVTVVESDTVSRSTPSTTRWGRPTGTGIITAQP